MDLLAEYDIAGLQRSEWEIEEADAEIERRVREGVAAGLAEYDRNLPGRMADVNRRYF